MGGNSVSEDGIERKPDIFDRVGGWVRLVVKDETWPPALRRPFDVECVIYLCGGIVAIAAAFAYLTGLDRGLVVSPLRTYEPTLNGMARVVEALHILWVVSTLFRALIRNPVRRAAGLPRDPAAWWWRIGMYGSPIIVKRMIQTIPDHARAHLPAWNFRDDRVDLPGLGMAWGKLVSHIVMFTVLVVISPGLNWISGLIVAGIPAIFTFIPAFRHGLIRANTLPPR